MSEIRGPEKISMLLSIAIVENVVLNLSRSNSFTSKIWKSTLRTVCQSFLRNSAGHFQRKNKQNRFFPSFLSSFLSFCGKGSCYLKENLTTKNQLTIQMTWQEGKSEGLREILSYDKRNRNAISTL